MIIKVDSVQSGEKSNRIKVGDKTYFAKKSILIDVGEYDVTTKESQWNGKTMVWIESAVKVNNTPTSVKNNNNRSFAMSYAKDLVVADKTTIENIYTMADGILAWLDGKEEQPEDIAF